MSRGPYNAARKAHRVQPHPTVAVVPHSSLAADLGAPRVDHDLDGLLRVHLAIREGASITGRLYPRGMVRVRVKSTVWAMWWGIVACAEHRDCGPRHQAQGE